MKPKRISGTIFRPTVIRYKDSNGKRVSKDTPGARRSREKSGTWRARYTDAEGRTKTCSLFDDRETSEAKLADILQRERELRSGIRRHDPFEVHRRIPLVCSRCSDAGCMGAKKHPGPCVENHLDGYRGWLLSKGNTNDYVRQTCDRVHSTIDGCGFNVTEDLDSGRVSVWLGDQRKIGLSPSTSNAYVTAVKSFGNWLLKDRRFLVNPFAHLSRVNQRVDVRVVRRILSRDELTYLISAAESGKSFRSLTGTDRAMLYLVAVFTGLRASELHSLTERSLNLQSEPPTVTLEAAYSKHRREDVLPLHPALADRLEKWLQRHRAAGSAVDCEIVDGTKLTSDRKLFGGTWPERAAKMMRRDLKKARETWIDSAKTEGEQLDREQSDFLLFETDDGRADFHSLRHTFISNLASSGVHPKQAKELARHSTITLTMDRYAHVGLQDMNTALETLKDIPKPPANAAGRLVAKARQSVVATMVALRPSKTSNSQELSEADSDSETDQPESRKSLGDDELPDELITSEKVRPVGFEPTTAGLEIRCSIQLSYGRVLSRMLARLSDWFFRRRPVSSHVFRTSTSPQDGGPVPRDCRCAEKCSNCRITFRLQRRPDRVRCLQTLLGCSGADWLGRADIQVMPGSAAPVSRRQSADNDQSGR